MQKEIITINLTHLNCVKSRIKHIGLLYAERSMYCNSELSSKRYCKYLGLK